MAGLPTHTKNSRRVFPINSWIDGLSDFNKLGGSYLWARGIDYRTEPSQLTLLPQPIKEKVTQDLSKWGEQVVGRTVANGNGNVPITNNSFEASQNNTLIFRGYAASGLEFAPGFGGTLDTNYFNSSQNSYNYFAGKKFATVRLPFIWERVQPELLGTLDPTHIAEVDAEIAKAKLAGLKVILDVHNYGRRLINADGGITESFTESPTSLSYPFADYSQSGNIVLRDYGEAFIGTANNPVSSNGYAISFNMKFNSRDHSFGGEGLQVRPMWISDNQCYQFNADYADGTWELAKILGGVTTILASGTKTWALSTTYAIAIDINQATNGFINVSVNGTPLFTTNSVASDLLLPKGQIAFFPDGMHVQLDTMVLNVGGSTSGGGVTQNIIGSAAVPYSYLADLWTKLATRYVGETTILGYDIMNEPHDMLVPTTTTNYNTTASVTLLMQAAINAIRAVDTTHYIIAEIDEWAGGQNFTTNYGSSPTPWLTDSANKLVYSFHYYFDNDHSGTYQQSFASSNNTAISGDVTPIMSWAASNSLILHCGEYGVPNTSAWQVCLTTFLDLCNTYNVWANHWAAGDSYTAVTVLQPTGSYPSYTDVLQMTIVGDITYLVPAATTGSGWTLGSDFFFLNNNAYQGNWAIKQSSLGGTSTLTTASGNGISLTPFTDYDLTFYARVSISSGVAPALSILANSLSGANILPSAQQITDTGGVYQKFSASFNSGTATSAFISIANQGGNVLAYYDYFTLTQVSSLSSFIYDKSGNLLKRLSTGDYTFIGTAPNSHGNGLGYYGEDDYLYITGDKTLGRYGPISSSSPTFVPDYLASFGGVPTNTNSVSLIAANSDYAVKTTPSSALKITGDLSLEAFIKPASLPAVGSSMTIAGLWKESGNHRGYILDILGISGVFGTEADGSLTISSDTTDSPIDSACSGTIATNQLFASNASFATGQKILIIQMQGSGAGTRQETTIQGYDSTNNIITLQDALNFSYNSSGGNTAQVIVQKQYSTVTINSGKTLNAKPWNGTVGGIITYRAQSTVNNGTITATGCGFRGGTGGDGTSPYQAFQGEGTAGIGTRSQSPNGNGGGGAFENHTEAAGGGGGNQTAGAYGTASSPTDRGMPGGTSGSFDLTTMTFGGGGGGTADETASRNATGGNGGGIVYLITASLTMGSSAIISANATSIGGSSGGGGSILIRAQTATLGTTQISAQEAGGTSNGHGGEGYCVLDYLTSYTGTTTPTLNAIQDNTLVTTTSYQARLGISNDGTAFEYLTQTLQNIAIGVWDRVQVSWASATSTATFYEGGNLLGTATGAKTAISASTADFAIGADFGASAYGNFFDGYINDVRVWSIQQTQAQFSANNLLNLQGVGVGLAGEWFLTASPNDLTANANNVVLTGSPTPVYVTDVPFAGATTRLDLDQTGGGTGQTYTLPTVLTEAAALSFTPAQDPQKSFQINISAKGTGNWTLVVHNGLNHVVEQMTIATASLPSSGLYEFIYPTVFTPVVGATYHIHLYSTVADGSIVTGSASDITTATYNTYYQFLLTDYDFHPIYQAINDLLIGNGRYVAKLSAAGGDGQPGFNAAGYKSQRLRLPAGWRVRCFAVWNEYYAIGCWKGSVIKDFDQGMVFLWDGYSVTYNSFFYTPQGAVNAMYGENGTLYIMAGYKGDLLEYTGADMAVKVKRIPKIGRGNYMEVLPSGMTYWQSLLRIAVGYNSDSTTLERGVYTWGTPNTINYPNKSLSYDYPISTGNRGTSVAMGMLLPVGGDLLIGWQDNVANGIDNVNVNNAPQTTGTLEETITDLGAYYKNKEELTVRADHLPLGIGANVDVKYKINYEDNWHNLGISGQAVGDTKTRLPILATDGGQFHAIQIATDLYASSGISPVLLEHSQDMDMLLTESDESASL